MTKVIRTCAWCGRVLKVERASQKNDVYTTCDDCKHKIRSEHLIEGKVTLHSERKRP